jgi:hypothetical protein
VRPDFNKEAVCDDGISLSNSRGAAPKAAIDLSVLVRPCAIELDMRLRA